MFVLCYCSFVLLVLPCQSHFPFATQLRFVRGGKRDELEEEMEETDGEMTVFVIVL